MPAKDGGETIEVTVRHATNGSEMKIVLPASAKFKHVKTALSRRLESDEILTRGQLMNNNGGVYSAYKDSHRIGDVRLILALCVDLEVPDDGPMEAFLDEGDISDAEEASSSSVVPVVTKSSVFNRARALSLQKELLDGFRAEGFQSKLAELESKKGEEYTQAQFAKERQGLFLTVQAAVLPEYGFEGSQAGVYKMMGAMGPFINDPEFIKLANEINRVIGVESPQGSWAALSKSCRKVDEQPHAPAPPRAQLPRGRGLPGLLGGGLGGLSAGFGTFAAGVVAAKPMADKSAATAKPISDKPADKPAVVDKPAASKAAAGKPVADKPAPVSTSRSAATTAPSSVSAAAPVEEQEEPPLFEPWPPSKTPPFKLYVAGSWNNYRPMQMQWQEGMFACPITLGAEGQGSFQLLLNSSWDRTLYPSMPDCSAMDDHTVHGPDGKGHGLNWLIGKYEEEEAKPRARFVIIAGMDSGGIVRLVSWQPVG